MMTTKHIEYRITFQPSGRTVYALSGTTVFEVAARAGLVLQNPCGGNGTCGKCRVRVVSGTCEPSDACRRQFTDKQLADGVRLACQARVAADCVVHVPDASLFEKSTTRILTASGKILMDLQPSVSKTCVELTAPAMGDHTSDLRRLEKHLGHEVDVSLHALRQLPVTLRENGFHGTAVLCCNNLIAVEPGDTTATCHGVAFDLGTTTVVGVLIDLTTGNDLAVAATVNPQVSSGDDVITRILQVRENPAALLDMRDSIIGAMNDLVRQLTAQAGISPDQVYEAVVTGNTTMQHLFCGISPAALGELPFTPAFSQGLFLNARDVGMAIHDNGMVFVFPNIGGFVGGDSVAGILAATLHVADKPLILVDIGTNGEIVLAHNGHLLATSTAAGPAFEGARITDGMRAADGAIEKVIVENGDISCNVIGNTAPAGLCGTALIDLVAELLRAGIIDATGRILQPAEVPENVSTALRKRIIEGENNAFNVRIVPAAESATGADICLYQKDVRELQLATGAIRAGVSIMLRKAGLTVDDVHEVLLAGAFGNFIRRSNASRIGLLPPVPTHKIRFIGNAACMGAKAVLLSRNFRVLADEIASMAEHVDLSSDPEFQMEFGMAMMFPEQQSAAPAEPVA